MASRGVVNELGFVTTDEYTPIEGKSFLNATELEGKNGIHGLPDYSHSRPDRIYVKTDKRGFREMRVYDANGKVFLEVAFHPERKLKKGGNVLHYHLYNDNLDRTSAKLITRELYEKYKIYLNHWGVFWDE